MYPSVNTTPDGLQPPPIASSAIKSSTTNHHGSTSESINNGRSTTLLVGGGDPKPSSSSSPPKSQDLPSVSNGNSAPTQTPPPPKSHQTHEGRNGENPNHSGSSGGGGASGDVFLQWGQKKRSKRTVGDKFSGGRTMPPPPPPPGVGARCGGAKVRTNSNGFSSKDASSSLRNRSSEDTRMGGGGGSGSGGVSPPSRNQDGASRPISSRSTVGKRSEKTDTKKPHPASFGGSVKKDKSTDHIAHQSDHHLTSPARGGAAAAEAEALGGKGGGEVVEWPRIYIALSRKEKEDDFFSMKGTKLPHRPKKRAKAIDRTLQYCFPGMWLSDLSRARYEVRERKSVKKPRRRGLKGLDSMESESD